MLRAITMENVAVRLEGRALDLPAAPVFRIDKEIKNVVTVVAKTGVPPAAIAEVAAR